MLFVLSAISPENFASVAKNVATVLKPGGRILFRDYGLYVAMALAHRTRHTAHGTLRGMFQAKGSGSCPK